jgi:DNA-binding CsgD family transcriptional regulator
LAGALRGARGGRGSLTLIEGAAGIGKTSLLEEAEREARAHRMGVASATSTEGRHPPFELMLELLRPLVASAAAAPTVFDGAASVAKPLFEYEVEPVSGGDRHFALIDGLYWLCVNLAERQPLLLAVDDVQWADGGSLAWLEAIARGAAELPVCIIAAVRTGEPEASLNGRLYPLAEDEPIRPAPLSAHATAEVVRARLGDDASDELCAAFARASGGNPLLVRELLRTARAAGMTAAAPPHAVAELGPSSIRELVERRMRGCSPAAQILAPVVAVLASHATLELAAQVAGLEAKDAMAAWAELDAVELTAPLNHKAPPLFAFRHPVLRRAVEEAAGAGKVDEVRLHAARRLAAAGRSQAAAEQLVGLHAPEVAMEPWVVPTLLEAARASAKRGGPEQAREYLDRALAGEPPARERREALLERGRLAAQIRDPGALDDLRAALELTDEAAARAHIALELGSACFYLARFEEAAEVCRTAGEGVERELALRLEAEALNADRLRGVRRERPRELASQVAAGGTPGERAVLVHVAAEAVATGDVPASGIRALAHRAWQGGRLIEEMGPAAPLISFLGTTFSWAEDWEATLDVTSAQLKAGQERRAPVTVSYALALSSGTWLRLGELGRAEAEAEQVVSTLPASDPLAYMITFGWLLEALVQRGRVDDAVRRLEESGLTGPLPDIGTVDFLLLSRGDVRLAAGDADAALADYLEVGERAERSGYHNPAGMAWRSRAAMAYLARGEAENAAALAREEADRARVFGAPRAIGIALRAVAATSQLSARIEALREAVSRLEESGAQLELAAAQVDLGAALIEAGKTTAAREALRHGMDGAHLCGAVPLVERAMELLRKTGMRPRRPALHGRDALTARQLQVVRLASEGRSNREIAEALFVTQRTVELHLTGAYRKLEISSRDELPDALAAPGR